MHYFIEKYLNKPKRKTDTDLPYLFLYKQIYY